MKEDHNNKTPEIIFLEYFYSINFYQIIDMGLYPEIDN